MGREEGLMLVVMRCQQISEMRGGMRGCREPAENGRNGETEDVAVTCS